MQKVLAFSGLILLLSASKASAGGFYLTDVGARGIARGGAFVAAPDDVLAIHYNPAALSLLRGLHVEASVSLVNMDVTFERKCPCTPSINPNAAALDTMLQAGFGENPANSNTVLAIPFLGIAYGLPILDLTVALAAYGPTSGRHNFGQLPAATSPSFPGAAEAATTRYSGLHMKTIEANFALGFGLQPISGLRVGAAIYGFQSGNNQTLHLWANSDLLGPEAPEDVALDIPILFEFNEPFKLNWGVGASYELIPGLTVGSSFRGKRDVRTDGKITIDLPRKLREGGLVEVRGEDVEVEVSTAPLWRMGLQYALPKVFTAEAAFVYEAWHVHDRVIIRPRNIEFDIAGMSSALPQIVAARNWRDTWSLRFGGEMKVLEPLLGLRAGYFYEPSAIAPEQVDPSRVDLNKHGFGLGAITTLYGFTLELSAMYIALSSIDVSNSNRPITAPLTGAQEYLTTIGNGRYSGSYFIGSASLTFALDPLMGAL